MSYRKPAAMAAAVLALAVMAGCAGEKKEAKSQKVIGVSVLTLANPFFKVMADSMVAEGKKRGYEVIVTSGELDPSRQKDQVSDFIVKKVSAIVLCPCNSTSIGTSIQEANKADIPVFTADIQCLAKNAKVVSHIATDNYSGGKLAGEAMVEALKGKGNVAIIDHPEIESVMLRTKGFREVLAKHKGMKIVSSVPGGALRDTSYKATQDVLEKNPELDGLFCINDPTALGALAAMEKAGRTGRIKVISFDGQPEAKEAVRAGKIYAEPVQFPDRIGAKTIESIAAYFSGKRVYAEELIPTELYRKADADKDPSLKKP